MDEPLALMPWLPASSVRSAADSAAAEVAELYARSADARRRRAMSESERADAIPGALPGLSEAERRGLLGNQVASVPPAGDFEPQVPLADMMMERFVPGYLDQARREEWREEQARQHEEARRRVSAEAPAKPAEAAPADRAAVQAVAKIAMAAERERRRMAHSQAASVASGLSALPSLPE